MTIFFRLLGILYILGCLVLFFYCFVFTGLSNHSSYNITYHIICYGLLGFILGLMLIFFSSERKFGILLFLFAIIILIFAGVSNVFNIMISYDEWLRRGMPEKYTFLFSK
ncbi:hypothetical protein [Treponema pedis]|uniref:hypothetical protein n=2 Tax=Treponema pedis TaxID=409322 RepID=UPI0004666256|nr:hypothetical protein [Treponema pedis]QSI03483.1 hypothetical protein DYQ05_00405 [Treponema pedis]